MTGYSSVMWLDLEAPPQERWKLGLSTENPPAPHPPPPSGPANLRSSTTFIGGHYALLTAPEACGPWRDRGNLTSGLIGDRSTLFFNGLMPQGGRWVFSVKATSSNTHGHWEQDGLGPLDRHRLYASTGARDLYSAGAADWAPNAPAPWLVADALDPPWLGSLVPEPRKHVSGRYSGLYCVDAIAYESVLVALLEIFQCRDDSKGCEGKMSGGQEFKNLHVGFSRDGVRQRYILSMRHAFRLANL